MLVRIFKKKDIKREVAVGKVAAHLCLTLNVKKLKISVENGRVVTTLNMIFCVASLNQSIGSMYEDLRLHCLEPTQHSWVLDPNYIKTQVVVVRKATWPPP